MKYHTRIDEDYLDCIAYDLEAEMRADEQRHGETSYLRFALHERLVALKVLAQPQERPGDYDRWMYAMQRADHASQRALDLPCVCELTEDINACPF